MYRNCDKQGLTACLGFCLLVGLATAQSPEQFEVSQADFQHISFLSQAKKAGQPVGFEAQLTLDGKTQRLVLSPHNLRSATFAVYAVGADQVPVKISAPPPTTYKGYLADEPGAIVAASYSGEHLKALIRKSDGQLWCVQPVLSSGKSSTQTHAVFKTSDLLPGDETCATSDAKASKTEPPSGFTPRALAAGTYVAEMAFDADYEYFLANGSSVSNTMADIEEVMNGVNLIYERDTSITHQLGTILVRTDINDPYTTNGSSALLSEFRSEWNANQGAIHRDIAHLMTGRDLDGSTIGVAYLGVICGSSAYGLSQSKFSGNFARRVGLTAHELGHNWSASHCNCNIMCASIGGCLGDVTSFSQTSIDSIVSHRDSRSCLELLLPDLAVTGTIGPDPLVIGEDFTITMVVSNSGTYVASNVVLTATLPPDTLFVSSQPGLPDGEVSGSLFTSQLGTLGVGDSTTATLTLNTTQAGAITSDVSVTSFDGDLDTADNSTQPSATILPVIMMTPATPFAMSVLQGEDLPPTCTTYTLTNQRSTPRNWSSTVGNLVSLTPTSGTLDAGASTTLQVCATSQANGLYAGTYNDTLTITDDSDGHQEIRSINLTVEPVATMPFYEGFESGTLPGYWKISGTSSYRTECTTQHTAFAGSYHLAMDDGVNGGDFARNEATVFINLEGYSNVVLTFWAREYGDEPHAPPGPFTGGADFDGVALSEDGETWYEVQSLRSLGDTYERMDVDLDQAIALLGLTYNQTFCIRFNQYDNFGITSDGITIDEVSVTGEGPVADFDEDGLPDSWEASYYGDSTNGLSMVDDDGDGLLNVEEYLLDSNPTNASPPLEIDLEKAGELHLNAIITPSSDARIYNVDYTPDPRMGSWEQVITNAVGSNLVTTLPASGTPHTALFRVRVSVP